MALRNPTYLTRSRHGAFHFRWRLWGATDAPGKPAFIKISLGTRDPKQALTLARMLTQATVSKGYGPGCGMRYEDLRTALHKHFTQLLIEHKQRLSANGPLTPAKRKQIQDVIEISQMAVDSVSTFLLSDDDNQSMLAEVIDRYYLEIAPGSDAYDRLSRIYPIAYRDFFLKII
ncbi:hypothetical protein [Methylobacterium sp. B1]|uniref:hypothetical protein n=1 Tax=Methylobacterium sp. B1 TaxID=91459 RepID=UPI0011D2C257|nr:hypothetical protein [Methylobacterium sp. B1]